MQIVITMDVPSWTEDNAHYYLDYLLEDIWNMNASTGDDARITGFNVNGTDYMEGYEGPEYELGSMNSEERDNG